MDFHVILDKKPTKEKERTKMNLNKLNPYIRSASVYERCGKSGERVAYDNRIIYMLSGDISVSVLGMKPFHLSTGQLLFIPAGFPYKLKGQYLRAAVVTFDLEYSEPEIKERLAPVARENFDPSATAASGDYAPFNKPIRLDGMDFAREAFERACNLFTSAEGNYRAELSAIFKGVLLKIAEAADENALPVAMIEGLDAYIRENIGEEISNTELGAIFGYHPFYISKVLKDAKGQTLRQYIINYRLKLAKRLLELTEKSINEIAEECGFTDASYFTKTFRTNFGMTPKDYRNSFKEDYI